MVFGAFWDPSPLLWECGCGISVVVPESLDKEVVAYVACVVVLESLR